MTLVALPQNAYCEYVLNNFEFCKTNLEIRYRIWLPIDAMCGLGSAIELVKLGDSTSPIVRDATGIFLGCNATCEWTPDNGTTWYPAKPASQAAALNMTWRIGPQFCVEDGNDSNDAEDTGSDSDADESDDPCDDSASCCTGMPVWRVSEPFATLWLRDEPLGYQPSRGRKLSFRLNYKQRDTLALTNTFNLGRQWECNFLSFIQTVDTNTSSATLFARGSGEKAFELVWSSPKTYSAKLWTSKLTRFETNTGAGYFWLAMRDGSTNYYRYTNGLTLTQQSTRWYLSEQIDPAGNTNRFEYETITNTVRLRYLVDADGLTNIIRYSSNAFDKISEVEDPYGRIARFFYDSSGFLTSCVDVIGFTNSFRYDSQGTLSNLNTLYGNTGFRIRTNLWDGGTNFLIRSVEVTQPDGGTQMYAYVDSSSAVPKAFSSSVFPSNVLSRVAGSSVDYANMHTRNSFYWSPRQYPQISQAGVSNLYNLTSNDLKIAHQKHWFRSVGGGPGVNKVGRVLSMERYPSPDGVLEGQTVWYAYTGTDGSLAGSAILPPSMIARILPDGTTNFVWYRRNQWGNPTNVISTYSAGGTVFERTNALIYSADGVDLLAEWTTNGATGIRLVGNGYNANHQMTSSTNAAGEVTTYTYDAATTLMTSRKTAGGLTTTNLYQSTAPFRLLQTIDLEIARTNSYTYTNDLVFTHTDERGSVTTNAYDALRRLTNSADARGAMAYIYNKLDLTEVHDRLGFISCFAYDSVRRKIGDTNALGNTNRYVWCTCGSMDSMVDALGQTTSYGYNNAGWRTNVTYADGSKSVFVHDLLGRVVRQRDPAGNWTTNTYNNQGRLTAVAGPVGQLTAMTYDYRDRVTNSVDANGVATVMTYDDESRLLTRIFPDGGIEIFGYSARGLITYTNQLSNETLYAYDEAGRKTAETNANLELTQFAYDPSGNLTNLLDGRTNRTRWKYDAFGRVTNKIDHLGTNLFFYSYDANSRLTQRTSAAKSTTAYAYDAVGNRTNVDYPVSSDLRMAYDALNRLTNMVDAAGTCRYSYTSFGALASEDGPWDNDTLSYTYTTQLRTGASLQAPNASPWVTSYAYDGANRLQTLTSPAGAFSYTFQGAGGLVKKLALPTSSYITNAFDTVARLTGTSLKNSGNTALNSHQYTYNPGGQRTNTVRTDGSYVGYAYDDLGQLTWAEAREPNSDIRWNEKFAYYYDPAHNLKERDYPNGWGTPLLQSFAVNALNELTQVSRSGPLTVIGVVTGSATNVTVNTSNAFLYGDSTFASTHHALVDGSNTFTAVARDSAGRVDTNVVRAYLPATNSFAHDLNGNLTTNGARVLEYDDENQLTRITAPGAWKSEFTYDGKMRRRIRKEYEWRNGAWVQTDEVRYVYDGNLVLQQRDQFNLPKMGYTRGLDLSGSIQGAGGIGGLLAFSQLSAITPQHSYYHADGNGNVMMLIYTNQTVAAKYLYDPFGNTLSASGPMADANLYRFSSKEWHKNSGLTYYLYRFYEPALQRWLNRDPIEEFDGLNLYDYVGNDPINQVDLFGYAKVEIRYNQLSPVGYTHAYIVVTDLNGQQTFFRGGPSKGGPSSGGSSSATGGSASNSNSDSGSSESSNSSSPGSNPCRGGRRGPWGQLVGQTGPYITGATRDYTKSPKSSQTLINDNNPASKYNTILQNWVNKVNAADIPYNPFDANSNAFAHQGAATLGISRPKPADWAPGATYNLPIK